MPLPSTQPHWSYPRRRTKMRQVAHRRPCAKLPLGASNAAVLPPIRPGCPSLGLRNQCPNTGSTAASDDPVAATDNAPLEAFSRRERCKFDRAHNQTPNSHQSRLNQDHGAGRDARVMPLTLTRKSRCRRQFAHNVEALPPTGRAPKTVADL